MNPDVNDALGKYFKKHVTKVEKGKKDE